MLVLTAEERRVARLLILLLVLGAVCDWREAHRAPARTHTAIAMAAPGAPPSEPTAPPAVTAGTSTPAPTAIDLNRATARELDALPGVGPVLAERILEHRRRFGSFRSVEDLRAVRGIGPRMLERLRPLVRIGS